jgi:hypothetical protein
MDYSIFSNYTENFYDKNREFLKPGSLMDIDMKTVNKYLNDYKNEQKIIDNKHLELEIQANNLSNLINRKETHLQNIKILKNNSFYKLNVMISTLFILIFLLIIYIKMNR